MAAASTSSVTKVIPPDKINLRLILVSGKIHEFLFLPTASASEIAQFVFDNWPEEWSEDKVQSANILKLIYHGRFLHGNVTLGALSLPLQKTTTMHLVARESLPEPNSQDNLKKSKSGSCCRCCTVMWVDVDDKISLRQRNDASVGTCKGLAYFRMHSWTPIISPADGLDGLFFKDVLWYEAACGVIGDLASLHLRYVYTCLGLRSLILRYGLRVTSPNSSEMR